MNNKERLKKLKELKIERRESGSFFKSADDCMIWIDNVAPLLKYDEDHYNNFLNHAKVVRITQLSAQTLMPHINSMVGIVNQAIIELENKIEIPGFKTVKKVWHDGFWGKVLVSVVAGIILIGITFLINRFIFSATNFQATKSQEMQQQAPASKQTNQGNPKTKRVNP
ncbi:MAG: hypothetical protein NTX36_02325 [Proteobacteria bacterium]|nr:hypothetical protein [Pseudomonadota bacterium]